MDIVSERIKYIFIRLYYAVQEMPRAASNFRYCDDRIKTKYYIET